jgi:hypothetical protein
MPSTLLWRAAGVGILAAAWALDSAWWQRWRTRWEYGSPFAAVVLAGHRWDLRRNQ